MKSMIRFVMINSKQESFDFKEYTTELMEKVEIELAAKDLEFYTNKDRMRKCTLVLKDKQYFVQFTFIMTHGTSQLKADISREVESKDDKELHDLKIKIKDLIIDEWEQCVWLEDRQSEELAEDLYKDVHSVENSLRRLINTILFYNLGGDWWEKYMPTHLTKKYNQRNDPYRDRAPSFKNIHTNLLSIDTGDLVTIISFKTYRVKGTNIFSKDDSFIFGFAEPENNIERRKDLHRFQYIMNNLMNDEKSIEGLQKGLTKILQEQMEVDKDFWEDYFAPWFSCNLREFQGKWENFSTDRNHVAHNKLIDNKLYQKFKKSMGDLLTLITEAEDKFSEHLEQEMNNFLEELEEMEESEYRQREADLRELMAEESGVEIRDEDDIIELLQEHINTAFEEIKQDIYYRSELEITYSEPLLKDNDENVFMIVHNAINNSITVDVEPFINAEAAGTSNVKFLVYYNGEYQESFEISYTNGEAEFNEEQGCFMPSILDELDVSALEELETLVHNLLEEKMPEIGEDMASFPCEECQGFAVNISKENEYTVGHCFICGHTNQVGECMKCEEPLDGTEDGFCESCQEFIDKQ
ncbi:hypothetical protein BC6307_19055 [Sutcliffiella cohnii]|uniref:Apea-like HEPN domain-containing protein n=2 Tax=Sutcliffiella cohnii TaxID=33932 RepID=A0A223KUR9_9BACI|nr:hypothetical protein [Sutcliffiella cohnii]AST93210.1 hypothetical protein BC6307_19055 [Sutcliffiella cohnii]